MKLELISFSMCPYVQRSVITLKYKKVPYELTLIDLENPPGWFNEISPLGKVPVLRVKDLPGGRAEKIIFESAVINELIDETVGEPLHPKDPYDRAEERAWIEYGGELMMANYQMSMAESQDELKECKEEFFTDLARLNDVVHPDGPYFRGQEFSLVDAAYAPLFVRLQLSDVLMRDPMWERMPRVRAWMSALSAVPAVKESVHPTFAQDYKAYLKEAGSLLF